MPGEGGNLRYPPLPGIAVACCIAGLNGVVWRGGAAERLALLSIWLTRPHDT